MLKIIRFQLDLKINNFFKFLVYFTCFTLYFIMVVFSNFHNNFIVVITIIINFIIFIILKNEFAIVIIIKIMLIITIVVELIFVMRIIINFEEVNYNSHVLTFIFYNHPKPIKMVI